jgi:Predicted nucleotide-binding protein containing TIR-like domain
MEETLDKPQVFIGSSSEELTPARTLAAQLGDVAFTKVWKDSQVFNLGNHTLEDLINELDHSMFGVFVLSPDDLVSSRGANMPKSRDNVVFELGLFMGRLGRQRTFMVVRRDPTTALILPSDLLGIKYATYELSNNDVSASVASAAQAVRIAIQGALTSGASSDHLAENSVLVNCNPFEHEKLPRSSDKPYSQCAEQSEVQDASADARSSQAAQGFTRLLSAGVGNLFVSWESRPEGPR